MTSQRLSLEEPIRAVQLSGVNDENQNLNLTVSDSEMVGVATGGRVTQKLVCQPIAWQDDRF
jgi:hypothetical protein